MAIENNLPIIFDVATHTEDGLMSSEDKVKLDGIEENLNDKLNKNDKITSDQLDISSDAAKIQMNNLSEEVIQAIAGGEGVSINAVVTANSVSTDSIVDNCITIEKLNKTLLLGNVVSPKPINFTFSDKQVSIDFPKGSLLMLDGISERDLAKGTSEGDVTVTLNYPDKFAGLNYIISAKPAKDGEAGTLSLVNNADANPISSTSSIVALVYITVSNTDTSSTDVFKSASIVMHGSYTINGLSQGIGTESAALMSTGKIVFDTSSGNIDFSEATQLHLMIGGVYNTTIENQTPITIAGYASDSVYVLYYDGISLKTALANTSTNASFKIALIKDGVIIPFVNTGIYYSKPTEESVYYTENFEHINNISLCSEEKINILRKNACKLEIPENSYVCLNQQTLKVENSECYYEDRTGLHYILFDIDTYNIYCRHYKETIPYGIEEEKDDAKYIVIGTLWVGEDYILVSGNFEYTIDSKTPYEDDLSEAESNIEQIQDIVMSDLSDNRILAADEIYMINGEELPIYESSMLLETVEGTKSAISYKKNNDIMSPRTTFFDHNILIDDEKGDTISLLAYDKYNKHSYLKKDINVKKVDANHKDGQTIKILCIGDDLINDKTAYYVRNKLISLGANPEMLGTVTNSEVNGEGRDGWFYSTFVGASGRGQKEGKINPQTSKGSSSETPHLLNPFLRYATADDKENHPNDCYRATGAYIEKTYYNDNNKNGDFFIFDFANYLEVQGIETPNVVVIALKPELCSIFTEDIVGTNMKYMQQMITGIKTALPNSYIAIIPQYGACTVYDTMWEITSEMVDETVAYVNKLNDNKIKVVSAWLHMNRETGTEYKQNEDNSQLYEEYITDQLDDTLSDNAKIELANAITAFIMNI